MGEPNRYAARMLAGLEHTFGSLPSIRGSIQAYEASFYKNYTKRHYQMVRWVGLSGDTWLRSMESKGGKRQPATSYANPNYIQQHQQFYPGQPIYWKPAPQRQPGNSTWIYVFLVLLLLGALVSGGYFCWYLYEKLQKNKPKPAAKRQDSVDSWDD